MIYNQGFGGGMKPKIIVNGCYGDQGDDYYYGKRIRWQICDSCR